MGGGCGPLRPAGDASVGGSCPRGCTPCRPRPKHQTRSLSKIAFLLWSITTTHARPAFRLRVGCHTTLCLARSDDHRPPFFGGCWGGNTRVLQTTPHFEPLNEPKAGVARAFEPRGRSSRAPFHAKRVNNSVPRPLPPKSWTHKESQPPRLLTILAHNVTCLRCPPAPAPHGPTHSLHFRRRRVRCTARRPPAPGRWLGCAAPAPTAQLQTGVVPAASAPPHQRPTT